MKIALIGYGKMGKAIEQIAIRNQHTVIRISPKEQFHEISIDSVGAADVLIDFSHPSFAVENIKQAARLKKNMVMGTTGWYDRIDEIKEVVAKANIGFIYSPNFSIGVQLFLNIVKQAASLINNFDEYDAAGSEVHHKQKADSPSGTAQALAEVLLSSLKSKTNVVYDKLEGVVQSHELHFSSLRCGHVPGTHSVMFDSPSDTITLTHEARNKEGFALGAVKAAEWLHGKTGFFTMQNMFEPKEAE